MSRELPVGLHTDILEAVSTLARRAGIVGYTPDTEAPSASRTVRMTLGKIGAPPPPTLQEMLADITRRQDDAYRAGDKATAAAFDEQIFQIAEQAGGNHDDAA